MVAKKDLDRAKKSREIRKAARASIRQITPQLIITSVICVLGVAGIMILTIYYGINIGIKSIESETGISLLKSDEYEAVGYESEEISFKANESCLADYNDCLLGVYGVKNTNYAYIKSGDQYRRFKDVLGNSVGASLDTNIDDDFFRTSSVIIIVKEDKYTAGYELKSVERNENYGLRIKIQQDELSGDVEASKTGHLVLVKVPNIQTTNIEVVEY